MSTLTRPTLSELMTSVNSSKWPERWNDIYDSVMDDYEANGCELLDPEYYDIIAEKYNILTVFREDYKRAAKKISEDENLSRVFAMICASQRDRENIRSDIKQLGLPKSADGSYDEKYTMIPALAMCATVDYTHDLLVARGLSEEHITYGMRQADGTGMVNNYVNRNNGRRGAMHWSWFQLGVDGRLLKSGSLQMEIYRKFNCEDTVFINDNGDVVVFAHGITIHRSGYVLGTKNYEDEEGAFEVTIEETPTSWIGYACDEVGLVKNQKTELLKSEWKKVLEPGDVVVNIHIPVRADISDEAVENSLSEIRELLAKHYPEFAYKAFYCGSWLLDPQLANLLKPESNIVKFGKKFTKIARKDPIGSDPLSFVFLQADTNNVDFESLPENTSLERSLKKHYLDGKRIYVGHGLILK